MESVFYHEKNIKDYINYHRDTQQDLSKSLDLQVHFWSFFGSLKQVISENVISKNVIARDTLYFNSFV